MIMKNGKPKAFQDIIIIIFTGETQNSYKACESIEISQQELVTYPSVDVPWKETGNTRKVRGKSRAMGCKTTERNDWNTQWGVMSIWTRQDTRQYQRDKTNPR